MKKFIALSFATVLLAAPAASRGAVILTLSQVGTGSNAYIVVSGGGTLDLTDLVKGYGYGVGDVLQASPPIVTVGNSGSYDAYGGTVNTAIVNGYNNNNYTGASLISGPSAFGTAFSSQETSTSGQGFGYVGGYEGNSIFVPMGYTSGSTLSASTTFKAYYGGLTIAELGLTPGGNYIWSWGTGQHADYLEIHVATPEPASMTMAVSAAVLTLGARRWSRRRQAQA